jgi:hypothetical protein
MLYSFVTCLHRISVKAFQNLMVNPTVLRNRVTLKLRPWYTELTYFICTLAIGA